MNKYTFINQKTFQTDRNNGIGASDIPILCGESKFLTPLELWNQKANNETKEISEDLQKLFTAGNEQEMITLWRFLKSRNDANTNSIFYNHLDNGNSKTVNYILFTRFQYNDYMFAHPDMVYFDGKKHINVEAKFVKYKGEWDFNDLTENGIPFKYYLQVQYQMLCMGVNETIVCANYQGAENFYFPVKANKDLFPKFEKICADFWGLVQRKEPPMPQSRSDIKKLFPKRNFKSIIVPEDIEMETMMLKDRYSYLKQKATQIEKEKEKIKSSVMALLTQNDVLQTSEGEQIAKISSYTTERIKALKKIKEENQRIFKYLVRNKMIESSETTKLYF